MSVILGCQSVCIFAYERCKPNVIFDVVIADVCLATSSLVTCVKIYHSINGKWVCPSPLSFLARGGVTHPLFLIYSCGKCVYMCFIALFFLTRGEAYESPVITKGSRLKCQVRVTTACNCPGKKFLLSFHWERLFAVAKTHTKLTPNPLAKDQASSEYARPTTQARI